MSKKHPSKMKQHVEQKAESSSSLRPTRIALKTLIDVRRELARVYRKLDAGLIESQEATRRGYLLNVLCSVIEASSFEERITELERRTVQGAGILPASRSLTYQVTH